MKRTVASFLSSAVLLGEAACAFALSMAVLFDLVTVNWEGRADELLLGAILVTVHLLAAGFLALSAAVVVFTRRFEMAPVAAFVGWCGSVMFAAYCCPGIVCVGLSLVVLVLALAIEGRRKP